MLYVTNREQAEKAAHLLGVDLLDVLDAYELPFPEDDELASKLEHAAGFDEACQIFYKAKSVGLKKLALEKAISYAHPSEVGSLLSLASHIDEHEEYKRDFFLDMTLRMLEARVEKQVVTMRDDREALLDLLKQMEVGTYLSRRRGNATIDKILERLIVITHDKEQLLELFDMAARRAPDNLLNLARKLMPLLSLEEIGERFNMPMLGVEKNLWDKVIMVAEEEVLKRFQQRLDTGEITPYDLVGIGNPINICLVSLLTKLVQMACEHVMKPRET